MSITSDLRLSREKVASKCLQKKNMRDWVRQAALEGTIFRYGFCLPAALPENVFREAVCCDFYSVPLALYLVCDAFGEQRSFFAGHARQRCGAGPLRRGLCAGFAVRADHVQVVQVVPLAGASLRNPAASTARAAVVLPY